MELISLVTHLLSFRALALSMRACKQIQSCALTRKLLFLMHLRFLIETVYFGTANCYCSQVPINLIQYTLCSLCTAITFQQWKFSCRASVTPVSVFIDCCRCSHIDCGPVAWNLPDAQNKVIDVQAAVFFHSFPGLCASTPSPPKGMMYELLRLMVYSKKISLFGTKST